MVLNGLFLEDINSQPEMLASALPDLRLQAAAIEPTSRKTVLTGSGDSLIAALAVENLFREVLDQEVRSLPALDASRFETSEASTVILVSVSGEVSRTIEAAQRAHQVGATTIAVTGRGESSLARMCTHTVRLPDPLDRNLPHARDFTATLAGLVAVLEAISGRQLEEFTDWVELAPRLLKASWDWVEAIGSSSQTVWFLGSGPERATAMYGALKFWEAGGMEAWWDDLEEFAHGSQLMARPGERVFLISSESTRDRALEMLPGFKRMGMKPFVLSTGDIGNAGLTVPCVGSESWAPLSSCFPIQTLTYVEAEARGVDVAVPLGGASYGDTFLAVHREWTKNSQIVLNQATSGNRDGYSSNNQGES